MRKAERTKHFIIEQSAILFNRKGIAGTSIDDIMAAANVSKGCLYGHFKNRREIAYACVGYLMNKITLERDFIMAKEAGAKSKLYALLDTIKTPLPAFFEGSTVLNLSVHSDETTEVVYDQLQKVIQGTLVMFRKILRDGVVSGEFSDDLNPEDFAMKILASVEGANAICRVMNSPNPVQIVLKSIKRELEQYMPD